MLLPVLLLTLGFANAIEASELDDFFERDDFCNKTANKGKEGYDSADCVERRKSTADTKKLPPSYAAGLPGKGKGWFCWENGPAPKNSPIPLNDPVSGKSVGVAVLTHAELKEFQKTLDVYNTNADLRKNATESHGKLCAMRAAKIACEIIENQCKTVSAKVLMIPKNNAALAQVSVNDGWQNWPFHIANLIYIQDASDKPVLHVIDMFVTGNRPIPIPFDEWQGKIKSTDMDVMFVSDRIKGREHLKKKDADKDPCDLKEAYDLRDASYGMDRNSAPLPPVQTYQERMRSGVKANP